MSARCSLMSLTPGVSTIVSRFSSSGDGWVISMWWTAAGGFLPAFAVFATLAALPSALPSPLASPSTVT